MSAKWQSGSLAIVGALIGGLGLGSARAANTESPSYQSSVTVDQSSEGEHGEAARLAGLAKIDVGTAMAAAQAQVRG